MKHTSTIVTVWTLLLLAALAVAVPCSALSYVVVRDRDLADRANAIITARVIAARAEQGAHGVVTDYRVETVETLKGDLARGQQLRVRVLGGVLPDGRGTVVWGMPEMAPGEQVLLFLRAGDGVYRIVHLVQGIFRSGALDGTRYWQRRTLERAGQVSLEPQGADGDSLRAAAEHFTTARHAERFTAWLADRARGIERPADYWAPEVRPLLALPRAKFTLLSLNPRLRWFAFDDGDPVFWSRHVDGQAGLADGGVEAFRNARRAWNAEPNTPIRLLPGASTSSTTGFMSSDRRNTILFRDFNNDMDSDFSCASGGTLAIGGFSFILGGGQRRAYKGDLYAIGVEAEIVINDGVECFATNDAAGIEQVYAHELGHTLGLGHSCGDENSPPCDSAVSLDRALMRASIRAPFTGARLQADDIAGIRYLYDPTFFDQQPGDAGMGCGLVPGSPRFCTDCSPCSSGQGDCDRDSECAPGLVCTDNRGADFGFAPGIDVCLPGGGGGGGGMPDPGCGLPPGHGRFCDECGPCDAGEGDCDSDAECRAGLTCVNNVGGQFGFDPRIDVCMAGGDPGSCTSANGRGDFCSVCGPCAAGEGDCDSDAECAPGLRCIDDIGPQFGFGPRVDVCQ